MSSSDDSLLRKIFNPHLHQIKLTQDLAQLRNDYVEVKHHPIPERRYGVFARKDIQRGECFLKEAPLAMSTTGSEFNHTLTYELLSAEKKRLFDNLWDGCCPNCKSSKVGRQWGHRYFCSCPAHQGDSPSLLFKITSYINHDCVPNSFYPTNCSDNFCHICIIATEDISAGSEITVSYIQTPATYSERKSKFWNDGAGFVCECQLCLAKKMLIRLRIDRPRAGIPIPDDRTQTPENIPTTAEIQQRRVLDDLVAAVGKEIDTEVYQTFLDAFKQAAAEKTGTWKTVGPVKLDEYVDDVERRVCEAFPGFISRDGLTFQSIRSRLMEQKQSIAKRSFTLELAADAYKFALANAFETKWGSEEMKNAQSG